MADKVIVVDDDVQILMLATHILEKQGINVTSISSGEELLSYIRDNDVPDLILLDIKMPGMDGFETYESLRQLDKGKFIPVIFLTGAEQVSIESKGLSMGAMDFIRKPFIPDVLNLRVRNIIDLDHLKRDLEKEVEKKSKENERLFIHVVSSLASAIDAKDTYTNGHSSRVAEYSREIARRAGYDEKDLEEIYMIGLLHDVGKIGVPDAVINKPAKLTEEEYELIKTHPISGARILGNIKEMPSLQMGARWHHERYDGKGYPDRLRGDDIPDVARIVAVADSYDAMTSHRSYRKPLPQAVVREEIENGKGTQFDSRFADIMLEMIDEDKDYKMQEG